MDANDRKGISDQVATNKGHLAPLRQCHQDRRRLRGALAGDVGVGRPCLVIKPQRLRIQVPIMRCRRGGHNPEAGRVWLPGGQRGAGAIC